MSFNEIKSDLKISYNSANENIINDFYNTVLSKSVKYDRISGYFNSTSLAIAAYGMDKFVKNGGHMRLLCSAELDKEDLESINTAYELKNKINDKFNEDYDELEDEFIKNHVKMVGWLVANGYLEIKIGVNKKKNKFLKNGILHSKIGILYDEEDNFLSFDGSVNETAFGWSNNIESFKVFYSWKNPEYIEPDIQDFEDFWNNNNDSLEVFEIPEATKNKLIEIAPKNTMELEEIKRITGKAKQKPKLRSYQTEAIDKWVENNKKGILSMATGTGKTFTALSCFDLLIKEKQKLLTIIVCPQKHLINQWKRSLSIFYEDNILIASGDNKHWKKEIISMISNLESDIYEYGVILTTFNTFSSEEFIGRIKLYEDEMLLMVDEVHGIGSNEFRKGLLNEYTYRLGLSATPEIEDDFERNEFLYEYFNGIIYNYDLEDAIKNGFLCHYNYYPIFIDLNDDELEKYLYYSTKIAYFFNKKHLSHDDEKKLNSYLINRRNIINNAKEKMEYLKKFLIEHKDISDLIIYCTGKQLPKIQEMLNNMNISNKKFTGEESTSQRDKILKLFSKKYFQVLVAIKCLDEGVDVPSTQSAILMASTLNTRQHIQRRGRILRKDKNKTMANIYDLIIFPNLKNQSESVKSIFLNEKVRYDEYVRLAENYPECSKKFIDKWEEII